jgi:hypothetical protein
MRKALLLVVLVLALGGCERGCLAGWLSDRGVATGPKPPGQGSAPQLAAIDCPDGLARCGNGIVQVSRAYHYADPCTGSPEQCTCPWERLGDCPKGCVVDGLVVDEPRDRAMSQLCAPAATARDGGVELSGPPPGDEVVSACDASFVCEHGVVIACGPPARAVGACTAGCAREGQSMDTDDESAPLTPGAALAVLCRR